ncbi:MAG TPA: UDP-N-acetylglucosamine 2-epimerase (non-hydrolyzing) [Rhodanobacteraceae bacterium]|nr:UDP-N-acetylglucosamine 2-epimerase (non-hydrolyzing) [Rhodanobacteraceae bacterium]
MGHIAAVCAAERGRSSRIGVIAGTRPEAIKLVALVEALRALPAGCLLINSGQHAAMVQRTLQHLGCTADLSLPQIAAPSLSAAVRTLRAQLRDALRETRVEAVVVQGDTSSAYAGALAADEVGLPLIHLEAGLRSGHPFRPFPEELFRRRIAPLAALHLAPTLAAARNLLGEGIDPARVRHVGNTVIDLLRREVEAGHAVELPFLPATPRLATLTLHRRENYGHGLDTACAAVLDLLAAAPDLGLVCPVHPNPAVGTRIRRWLGTHPRIVLTAPLDYRPFIALLARSQLVVTDSGGIQEEAPYLGTPVLVVRENTERPEAVALGAATLVPLRRERILAEAQRLLAAPRPRALAFDAAAPFGDGRAALRCAAALQELLAMRDASLTLPP